MEGNADAGKLQSALAEVARLRAALERSEEQLWEAKGQLLIDRERITVLEHQLAEAQANLQASAAPAAPVQKTVSEAAHRSILETVFRELSAIENALRLEIVEISALEREIAEWRAAVAASESRYGART
jgi:chromosome segregation ATPase